MPDSLPMEGVVSKDGHGVFGQVETSGCQLRSFMRCLESVPPRGGGRDEVTGLRRSAGEVLLRGDARAV